jgi:hypothetical protein
VPVPSDPLWSLQHCVTILRGVSFWGGYYETGWDIDGLEFDGSIPLMTLDAGIDSGPNMTWNYQIR